MMTDHNAQLIPTVYSVTLERLTKDGANGGVTIKLNIATVNDVFLSDMLKVIADHVHTPFTQEPK